MKALSIRQPWATLIMHHGKDIENRDWPTHLRGRIAIHASAKLGAYDFDDAMAFLAAESRLPTIHLEREKLPLGVILGTVEIVDCVRDHRSPWFFGPRGFVLRDPRPLAEPIAIKGALSFWDVPAEIAAVLG